MLRFKLREFLDQHDVSAYRLAQEIDTLEDQTIFAYARGSRNPSLKSLGLVVIALEKILERRVGIGEVLEVVSNEALNNVDVEASTSLEDRSNWVLVPLVQQAADEEAIEGQLVTLSAMAGAGQSRGFRGFRFQGFVFGFAFAALIGLVVGVWLPLQSRVTPATLIPVAEAIPTPVLIGPEGTIQSVTPTLRVTARTDAERYEFSVRSTRSNRYLIEAAQSPVPRLLIEEGVLDPGDRYIWSARVWNEDGWSSFASPLTFVIEQEVSEEEALEAVPPAPQALEKIFRLNTLTPTLKVEGAQNVDWYGFYIRDLVDDVLIYDNDYADGPSVTLPQGLLEPGKSYRWNARARNEAGWGAFSERNYFVTTADAVPSELSDPPILEGVDRGLVVSGEMQEVTLIGQKFAPGTRVLLTTPSGKSHLIPAGRTIYRGKGALEVLAVLDEAGDWSVRALTLSGLESNEINFNNSGIQSGP